MKTAKKNDKYGIGIMGRMGMGDKHEGGCLSALGSLLGMMVLLTK